MRQLLVVALGEHTSSTFPSYPVIDYMQYLCLAANFTALLGLSLIPVTSSCITFSCSGQLAAKMMSFFYYFIPDSRVVTVEVSLCGPGAIVTADTVN